MLFKDLCTAVSSNYIYIILCIASLVHKLLVDMTVTNSLFIGLICQQYGYRLAWDTHVTGGPPAPMVRWRLVHRLGLGLHVSFRTCGLHMSRGIWREWVAALVGCCCR